MLMNWLMIFGLDFDPAPTDAELLKQTIEKHHGECTNKGNKNNADAAYYREIAEAIKTGEAETALLDPAKRQALATEAQEIVYPLIDEAVAKARDANTPDMAKAVSKSARNAIRKKTGIITYVVPEGAIARRIELAGKTGRETDVYMPSDDAISKTYALYTDISSDHLKVFDGYSRDLASVGANNLYEFLDSAGAQNARAETPLNLVAYANRIIENPPAEMKDAASAVNLAHRAIDVFGDAELTRDYNRYLERNVVEDVFRDIKNFTPKGGTIGKTSAIIGTAQIACSIKRYSDAPLLMLGIAKQHEADIDATYSELIDAAENAHNEQIIGIQANMNTPAAKNVQQSSGQTASRQPSKSSFPNQDATDRAPETAKPDKTKQDAGNERVQRTARPAKGATAKSPKGTATSQARQARQNQHAQDAVEPQPVKPEEPEIIQQGAYTSNPFYGKNPEQIADTAKAAATAAVMATAQAGVSAAEVGKTVAEKASGLPPETRKKIITAIAAVVIVALAVFAISSAISSAKKAEEEQQAHIDSFNELTIREAVAVDLLSNSWPIIADNDYVDEAQYEVESVTISSKDVGETTATAEATIVISNGFFEQTTTGTVHASLTENKLDDDGWHIDSWSNESNIVIPLQGITNDVKNGLPNRVESKFDPEAQTCKASYSASSSKWYAKESGSVENTYEFNGTRWVLKSHTGEVKSTFDASALMGAYEDTTARDRSQSVFSAFAITSVDENTGDLAVEFSWVPAESVSSSGNHETVNGTATGTISETGAITFSSKGDRGITFSGYADDRSGLIVINRAVVASSGDIQKGTLQKQ